MNSTRTGGRRLLRGLTRGVSVFAALAVVASCGSGGGSAPVAGLVVTPDMAATHGLSYPELADVWWHWALEQPRTHHPLFDETGADAGRGQGGDTWFLGGVFNQSGVVTRNITIPRLTRLFFPVLDVSWDNQVCSDPDTTMSLSELEQLARSDMDGGTNLFCSLDGQTLLDAATPAGLDSRTPVSPLTVLLPADNIFASLCGDPVGTTVLRPLATDGVYLLLSPLAVGEHTLLIRGEFPDFGQVLDITYRITVGP